MRIHERARKEISYAVYPAENLVLLVAVRYTFRRRDAMGVTKRKGGSRRRKEKKKKKQMQLARAELFVLLKAT